MVEYVVLDVSLKETSFCVVAASEEIVFEGRVTSDPDAIASVFGEKARSVARFCDAHVATASRARLAPGSTPTCPPFVVNSLSGRLSHSCPIPISE